MKGGTKIRKLWEILKTQEPPGLSVSFKDTVTNSAELYSAIVLINTKSYTKYEDLIEFIKAAYKKLEYKGILFFELPDSLMCNTGAVNPEYLEKLYKEASFQDIRTYKTPLNSEGYSNYIVIGRKTL